MPQKRIRSIKPEIWDSRDFMALSVAGKLTFMALFSHADDEGRFETDPRHIHDIAVRDFDVPQIAEAFEDMQEREMICSYRVNGRVYIQVLNFGKHQRIDRPRKSELPAPPEGINPDPSATPPEDSSNVLRTLATDPRSIEDDSSPRARPRTGSDQIGSDRIGGERTGTDLYEAAAAARAREDRDLDPEVAERMRLIAAAAGKVLGRQLLAIERAHVENWAQLERGGQPVPAEEVIEVIEEQMARTDPRSGKRPTQLGWCQADVVGLQRVIALPLAVNGGRAGYGFRPTRTEIYNEQIAASIRQDMSQEEPL